MLQNDTMLYIRDKCRNMTYSNTPPNVGQVNEAAISYDSPVYKYTELIAILGGSKTLNTTVRNEMDLINLSRTGLPKKSLDTLSKKLNISMERLSQLLHISHRTLQRKAPNEHLSVHISEQILSIAEVIRRGIEVLGDEGQLEIWLHSALPTLSDRKPIDLMDTIFGTTLLLKILGRIEHGIY